MIRPLSPGETRLAADLFGDAIDYAAVTVRAARWWPFQPADVCMAPDGHLWLPPGGYPWPADFATAPFDLRAFFIHEMTHVWQAQRGGRWYLPLIRHPFCRYRYRLTEGRRFRRYGIEQQAEIAADAWRAMQGRPKPGSAALDDYLAILPFRGIG